MDLLRLKEAVDKLARKNDVRWYGHVLRRPKKDVLMMAMMHKIDGKLKQGRNGGNKLKEALEGLV